MKAPRRMPGAQRKWAPSALEQLEDPAGPGGAAPGGSPGAAPGEPGPAAESAAAAARSPEGERPAGRVPREPGGAPL